MSDSRISFDPLFRTMKEKNISTYKLFNLGFSRRTYYRIKNNHLDPRSIGSDIILQLCDLLDCRVEDIMEYVPAENNEKIKTVNC